MMMSRGREGGKCTGRTEYREQVSQHEVLLAVERSKYDIIVLLLYACSVSVREHTTTCYNSMRIICMIATSPVTNATHALLDLQRNATKLLADLPRASSRIRHIPDDHHRHPRSRVIRENSGLTSCARRGWSSRCRPRRTYHGHAPPPLVSSSRSLLRTFCMCHRQRVDKQRGFIPTTVPSAATAA